MPNEKTLSAERILNLQCGLQATAEALRKLGDTEGRSQWCDLMAKELETIPWSEPMASQWIVHYRESDRLDRRLHRFFVTASTGVEAAEACMKERNVPYDDIVKIQLKTSVVVTRKAV